MRFTKPTHDARQWTRAFAFIPTKVGERGGAAEYVWLERYEWRLLSFSREMKHFEFRRIGATEGAKHSYFVDTAC